MTECVLRASNWVTNRHQELTIDREEEYFNLALPSEREVSEGSGYAQGRRVGGHKAGAPSLAC